MVYEIINITLILGFSIVAAVCDIRTRRIPNKLILCMLGAWLMLTVFRIISGTEDAHKAVTDGLSGAMLGGGIFLAVYLVSRRGLGAGDVKFMTIAGLYLGIASTVPAILYGTVLAALTGMVLILFKKISRKDKIPLAPFLLAGIVLTVIQVLFYR